MSASRFFASSEWPVCAPLSRSFVFVKAIRVGKIFSRGPAPDILDENERLPGMNGVYAGDAS